MNLKIFILPAFFFPFFAAAQNLTAHYRVTQTVKFSGQETSVQLSGTLWRKGNTYLYVERPEYLQKYPDGNISISTGNNGLAAYRLNMDTVQSLSRVNYDSLITQFKIDSWWDTDPSSIKNVRQPFESDCKEWEILPETKVINGLTCQKAINNAPDGTRQFEIWFTSDIPMQSGIEGTIGVPGLVVEATCVPLLKRYILESYSNEQMLTDTEMWPIAFNKPFMDYPPLRKEQKTKPNRIKKQLDVSNSNQ
ncbi:MAG: GLPGLI family protein [Chitinophagaceae bacterium]